MKIQVCRYALLAASLVFLNSGIAFSADTTPPAMATPGTPAETDTKSQENNPAGPAKQVTKHPHEGTKKKKHKTHAPADNGTTQSGDKATKTPQKETTPSTPSTNTTNPTNP